MWVMRATHKMVSLFKVLKHLRAGKNYSIPKAR